LLPRALALRVLPALDATLDAAAAPADEQAVRAELDGSDALTRILLVHAVGRSGRAAHRDAIRRAATRAAGDIDPLRILGRIEHNQDDSDEDEEREVPSLAETMVALREVAPFGELAPAELHELAKRVRWETRGEGDAFGEDEAIWALVSGRAAVDGVELRAPAAVGERARFGAGVAPRAVAAERTRLLHLSREDFEQAVDAMPGIALAVGRTLLGARP